MRNGLPGEIVRKPFEQVVKLSQRSGPRRVVGQDEVHGLADRVDARGLLVGHLHAVLVLQLLHQRVEVQRVRGQVVAEVRGLLDPLRVELQLVGQVLPDQLEDFVARHDSSGTLAAASDAFRSAPAACRRAWVRPATSSRTPRAATSIARSTPRAPNEPWGTTPSFRSPSRTAPPCSSGEISSRSPRRAGRSSIPPSLDRQLDIAAVRTAPSSALEEPSMTFSATLPVKPSATITSASPVPIANPSTLPTKFRPGEPSSSAWAETTISGPLVDSVPLDSSAT